MPDLRATIELAKPAAAGQNQFDLELLKLEAAAHPHKNVFISPLSIYLALAMTEAGSDGKTRAAMRKVLAVPDGVNEESMHAAASAMLQALKSETTVELSIANAIWADPSMPFSQDFIAKTKSAYEADAKTLEFTKPGAAEIVNGWVSEKTKGKIPSIVSADTMKAARAILANAVYFMGRWKNEFVEASTQPADFHLAGGGVRNVRMMDQPIMRGAYNEGDNYASGALQYAGSSIYFYALLPSQGATPEDVLAKLKLSDLIGKALPYDLHLKLPKMTIDYSDSLKSTLEKMGMGIAFQYPGADFAPMGSKLFYIGDVIHKTRLEVDEKATVAAAATAVMMMAGSAAPQKRELKTLVFDRPFAVLIADTSTGAVLFSGVVYEP